MFWGLAMVLCCQAAEVRQVFLAERFQRGDTNVSRLQEIDTAHWIWHPTATAQADADHYAFLRFSRTFDSEGNPLRFDVSADERFILLLDGKAISFGPHRGMPEHWLYQSYEADLTPGKHTLEAVVWVLGPYAPSAQLSWRGGFILKAWGDYDKRLTTGIAEWRVAELKNTRMLKRGMRGAVGVGAEAEVRGESLLHERPAEAAFVKAVSVRGPVQTNVCGLRAPGWMLFPTPLPDQTYTRCSPGSFRAAHASFDWSAFYKEEDGKHPMVAAFNALLKEGHPVTVPTNTILSVLLDLDDYYCAYPELTVGGGKGSEIRWMWVESPKDEQRHKGNRDVFAGKCCSGTCDRFFPDGRDRASFTLPWWRAGRWCQLEIKTVSEPLTFHFVGIAESRYPLEPASHFTCDDPTLAAVQKICIRGMQMDLHETMCDGPYYEQQMYPGDTLVQSAIITAMTRDDRPIRRAISLFDFARRDNGMLPMNFPTVGTQESATYTMLWPIMLEDYMMWHDNAAWLKARLPGLNHTMFGLRAFENADGLLDRLPGWSFMDWVPAWHAGIAPDGRDGVSALNNLFYLLALQSAARVSAVSGDDALAAHWRAKAEKLGHTILATFWDGDRGMVADTVKKDRFSEHAQCLAILAGILAPDQARAAMTALENGEKLKLARATLYFSHYLFSAYAKMGRTDLFLKRLDLWRMQTRMGLRCPLEDDDIETKSDCHAWGGHPLFHLHADVAGVKPAEPFFQSVRIAPQPGGLKWIDAATPHPKGMIVTKLTFEDGTARGEVTLPTDVKGVFEWQGKTTPLKAGRNEVGVR